MLVGDGFIIYTYAASKERNAVATVLTLGDAGHLLHGPTVRQYIPLASQPFVAKEIEQPLRRHRQPHRRGSTENNPRWLARVVDALAGHHLDILANTAAGIELVPLVHGGGAHTGAEVVCHALCQLQHTPAAVEGNGCHIQNQPKLINNLIT